MMIANVKLRFWSIEVAVCEEGNIAADSGQIKRILILNKKVHICRESFHNVVRH